MSHVIRVKPDTYRRLQEWAEPLKDSANAALEHALDAADAHRKAPNIELMRKCLADKDLPELSKLVVIDMLVNPVEPPEWAITWAKGVIADLPQPEGDE